MNWLVLTILAIVSRAAYSLSTRILSKDVHVRPQTQSFLFTFLAGILSLFASPFLGGIDFSGTSGFFWPISIILLVSVSGNIIYFKGQKELDAGTTQIAFSSILIWGSILSVVFLGSRFSFLQILGIILMLVAIVTIQFKQNKFSMNSSVFLIIGSAFLFAIYQVASATISAAVSTATYLMIIFFGTALGILLLYVRPIVSDMNTLIHQVKNTFLKTMFASGTTLLYSAFSFLAYGASPDRGVVVVLLTAQVVLSVIFGIVFLKERDNVKRKMFAGVLAFIAGVLIKS